MKNQTKRQKKKLHKDTKKLQDYTLEDCIIELNKHHIEICREVHKINSIIFYDIVPHQQKVSKIMDIIDNLCPDLGVGNTARIE